MQTLVVMAGCLSFYCLSISLNQSVRPFSSDLWRQQGIVAHRPG